MMNTEILDVKEVAEYLKFSTKKIYQLIQNREIPYRKIGGQYRFVKSEIDKWVLRYFPGDRIQNLLAKTKEIDNKLKKQLFIVAILTRELGKQNLKPVVVGGFAVEFYTVGGYNTGDIDLIFPDNELLDKTLVKIGFSKEGRHWINKDLDVYIESPGTQLTEEELKHITEVDIEGLPVYLIGTEDLIIDRLNAYVHWKSTDEGNWIKELMFINYDKLDWSYLNKRSKEEKTYSALIELKQETENEKNKL